MTKTAWELTTYTCEDGKQCLVIRNTISDSKLGALSLDHRSIGEEIVLTLNLLEKQVTNLTSGIKRCRNSNRLLHRDFDRLWEMCLDKGWTEDELIKELEQ